MMYWSLILLIIVACLNQVNSIPYTCFSGTGSRASFYNNYLFRNPSHAHLTVNNINWNAGTGKPPNAGNLTVTNLFSVYYSGVIVPSVSGNYNFRLESDDGSRMNFEGKTIISSFVIQPAKNTSSTPAMYLEAGQYYFYSLDFFENQNNALFRFYWSINGGSYTIVPTANLLPCMYTPVPTTFNCSAAPQGLEGTYYPNIYLNNSVLVRTDAFSPFKQDWSTGSPNVVVPTDYFSVSWRGTFSVNQTNYYMLCTISQERVNIYVNDVLLQSNALNDSSTIFMKCTPTMYLVANGEYFLKIEYFEDILTASFELILQRLGLNGFYDTMPLNYLKLCFPPAIVATDRVSISGASFVTITVSLRTQPANTVYVYLTPSTNATVTPCVLIFTPSNWNLQQIVYASTSTVPATISYLSSSADSTYNGLTATTIIYGSAPAPVTITRGKTCISWGDPHFVTFDELMYDLYTTGDYYLVRSLHSEFVVQTRQLPCSAYSCNYACAIKYYNSLIIIYLDQITGVPRIYSNSYVSTLGTGFTLNLVDTTYTIKYPNGIEIVARMDFMTTNAVWYMSIYITVPTYYQNLLRGLCGTYDGAQANDYHDQSGSVVSFSSFHNSWLVPTNQNLFLNQDATIPTIPTIQPAPSTFLTCGTPTDPETITFISDPTLNINQTANYTSNITSCGLSLTSVQTHCSNYLLLSPLAIECTTYGVNTTALYLSCVHDIMAFCDMAAGNVAGTTLVSACIATGKNITSPLCTHYCNLNGECLAGNVCNCTGGWTGQFCSEPPNSYSCVTSVVPSSGVAGDNVTFYGNNFENTSPIVCRFGTKSSNGTANVYINTFSITCQVPPGIQGGSSVQVSTIPGKNCGGKFTYTSGSGSLDPHFFGFHKEKMEVKRDSYAANQIFHLFCSDLVTITTLFFEYPDELLFMTRFWVRLGDLKFTLDLSTTPKFISDHQEIYFKSDEGRHHLDIDGGSMEWDDNVLRIKYRYLKINFSNKIYLTESPYMNVDVIPEITEEYPKEDRATGIIGRTLNRALTPQEFEKYLQFKAFLTDVVDFKCSIPFDLI